MYIYKNILEYIVDPPRGAPGSDAWAAVRRCGLDGGLINGFLGERFIMHSSRWLVVIALSGLFLLRRLVGEELPLKVSGPDKGFTVTAAEFAALPQTEITAMDPHEKKEHHYSGVAMKDLLAQAGAPLGEKLRGAAQQLVVVLRAKDSYVTAFALAEFDDAFSSRTLLLANKIDGQPLPDKAAPYQLIVPGDKKAARWARMVTSIEVAPALGNVVGRSAKDGAAAGAPASGSPK